MNPSIRPTLASTSFVVLRTSVGSCHNPEAPLDGDFAKRVLDGFTQVVPPETDGSSTVDAGAKAITIESLVLGFQATEAYLRQLMAHWDALNNGSPWLEIAAQPMAASADKFEKRIAEIQRLTQNESREMVRALFIPNLRQAQSEHGAERVDAFIESVHEWNQYLIGHFFQFRNTYNSAKHGLASIPNDIKVSFAAEQEGSAELVGHLLMAGPALQTLEYERLPKSDGGGIRWLTVTQVFDPAVHVRTALFAADLLSHIWKVGRLVHLGTMAEIYLAPRMSVSDGTRPHEKYRPGRTAIPVGLSSISAEQKALILGRIVESDPSE